MPDGRGTPALLGKYAVAAGLSIAVVVPVTQTFAGSYKSGGVPEVGLRSYLLDDHGQPVTDPPAARLELAQLVTPGREAASREEGAYGGGRYLGVLSLLLALAGLVRRPREALPLLAVALLGLVLALGTYLTRDGTEVLMATGGRVRLPVLWLNRLLGYVAEPLNFPVRFLAMTVTAVAGLAALAFAPPRKEALRPGLHPRPGLRLSRREGVLFAVALLAVVEVQWGQLLDRPWAAFKPREADALEVLQQEEGGAVLDLALAVRSDHENRWSGLATQIAHGKPTQAVPVERIEYFARDGFHFVNSLQLVDDLAPLYENRGGALQGPDPVAAYRGDLALLQEAGFRWIVVSFRYGDESLPPGIVAALDQLCGPAVAEGRGLGAWRLPEVAFSAEELAEWQAAHARGMSTSARMTPGMGPPPESPPPAP